jgi:hypothetical protein
MLPFFNVYSISEHDVHMLHGLVTLASFFFLKPFNINHELVCLFVFAAAACGCRDPVRAPLKHE